MCARAAGGRLTSVTTASPGLDVNLDPLPTSTTTYQYDYQNRLTDVLQPGAEQSTHYGYTPTSTTITDPVGNETTWNYDGFGRLASEVGNVATSRRRLDACVEAS